MKTFFVEYQNYIVLFYVDYCVKLPSLLNFICCTLYLFLN